MSCPQRLFIKFSSNQVGGQDKELLAASAACQLVLRRPLSERADFVHCESLVCGGAEHYHVLVDCDFRDMRPATNKEVSIRCFRVDSSHSSPSDISLEEIHVQRTLIDEIPWGRHPPSSPGKPSTTLHPASSSSSSLSSSSNPTILPAQEKSRSRSRRRSSSSSTTPSADHSPARAASASTPLSSPPTSPSTSPVTSSPGVFQPRRLKSPLSTSSGTASPLSLQPSDDSAYSRSSLSSTACAEYIPFVNDSMPQNRYFAFAPTHTLLGTGQGQGQGAQGEKGQGRKGHERDLSGHFGECISSLTLSP